jgi:glycosyltransferase involved in cell wall biosynthesis
MTGSNGNRSQLAVAFDTWTLASHRRNMGTYVYAKNLLAHFREIAREHSIEFRPFVSATTSNDANEVQAGEGFRPFETNLLKFDRAWRFGGASFSASVCGANLMFCPAGNTLPVNPFMPVVATIHDLIPIVLPSHLPKRIERLLRMVFAHSARYSRTVITDSVCSKKDLINVFGLPESKVHVVYLGYNESIFNGSSPDRVVQNALFKKLGLEKPYVLHHGTIQPRKNLKRLIEAYRLALSRDHNLDFDLVLVGQVGWQYEEILAAARLPASRGRVVLPGPQNDSDLAMLLKGASLVVVPSLYEGFCLPMLEAMACGAPTICSNSSCLPEVSGGVLRYFDPLSIEEMAACIGHALENSALRQSLSFSGKRRASFFSWRRCAEETLAILKSAAAD